MHIPLITGKIYKDIQLAYAGGHTDMYKPYAEDVKVYDANALYPTVMKWLMPTAWPAKASLKPQNNEYFIKEFEGDISLINKNPFGFFFVEVTCPDTLDKPILPVRFDTGNGVRSIYPTGTWKGWYYSEELINAEKYGYTYKIHRGYLFNKGHIFFDYVDDLFKIRSSYDRPWPHPMNFISKLLMNSLYGRFGMRPRPIIYDHIIIDEEELPDYLNKGIIREHIVLNSKKCYIVFENSEEIEEMFYTQSHIKTNSGLGRRYRSKNKNISIPIAAAVSANARIYISQFLNNDLYEVIYMDTDSLPSVLLLKSIKAKATLNIFIFCPFFDTTIFYILLFTYSPIPIFFGLLIKQKIKIFISGLLLPKKINSLH